MRANGRNSITQILAVALRESAHAETHYITSAIDRCMGLASSSGLHARETQCPRICILRKHLYISTCAYVHPGSQLLGGLWKTKETLKIMLENYRDYGDFLSEIMFSAIQSLSTQYYNINLGDM